MNSISTRLKAIRLPALGGEPRPPASGNLVPLIVVAGTLLTLAVGQVAQGREAEGHKESPGGDEGVRRAAPRRARTGGDQVAFAEPADQVAADLAPEDLLQPVTADRLVPGDRRQHREIELAQGQRLRPRIDPAIQHGMQRGARQIGLGNPGGSVQPTQREVGIGDGDVVDPLGRQVGADLVRAALRDDPAPVDEGEPVTVAGLLPVVRRDEQGHPPPRHLLVPVS